MCQKEDIKRKLHEFPMSNNLLGLYRINAHHITNYLVVESLLELLSSEEAGDELLTAL